MRPCPGQVICVSASVLFMLGAFLCVKPRAPDFVLLILGEMVQFASAGVWFVVSNTLREYQESMGTRFQAAMEVRWDAELVFYIFLGGLFQALLLYF